MSREPTEEMLRAGKEAYDRKLADMASPYPTEESGIGPIGYAYIAMHDADPEMSNAARLAAHCQSLIDVIDNVQDVCGAPVADEDMEMVRYIETVALKAISAPHAMATIDARAALHAIANLPTGRNEDVMEGQEQAYRAVEALFSDPPHITAEVGWYFERLREEVKAGKTQNALSYLSFARADFHKKGFREGIDEALQIAREQAALMADLAIEGLPENARAREAMEAAIVRFSTKLTDALSALSAQVQEPSKRL